MSLDRLIEQGSTGTVESETTFTDAVVAKGYIKQRLAYPRLNASFRRHDRAINDLIDGRVSFLRGSTRGRQVTARRLSTDAITWAPGSANRITVPDVPVDPLALTGGVIDGTFVLLYVDYSVTSAWDKRLGVIDIETGGARSVTIDGLPSGAWVPQAICAELGECFVALVDAPSGWTTLKVQKYRMSAGSTWHADPLWPAEGLTITSDYISQDNFIIATADLLALPSTAGVVFVSRATGSIVSTGFGDHTPLGSIETMCSNGSCVFYTDPVGDMVASISISDPSIGCGGVGWPVTSLGVTKVTCMGDLVAYCVGRSDDPSTVITLATQDNAVYGVLTMSSLCTNVVRLAFDARNLWALAHRTIGATSRNCLIKVPYQAIIPENSSTAGALTPSDTGLVFGFAPIGEDTFDGRLVPDGRDLWIGGGMTDSIYRLPFSVWR